MATKKTAAAAKEEAEVKMATVEDRVSKMTEYTPYMAASAITLSIKRARLLATPTASGAYPSDQDCWKWIQFCEAQLLNPFLGDCFLIGYDTKDGAKFNNITAHQSLLKRAEANEKYDGMESGVFVFRDGEETDLEGDYYRPTDKLLGAWARVHRKDRKINPIRRVNFTTFDTGRSRWAKDPGGMIVKCAEADGLRSAFPNSLGGMYNREEMEGLAGIKNITSEADLLYGVGGDPNEAIKALKAAPRGVEDSPQPETRPEPAASQGAPEAAAEDPESDGSTPTAVMEPGDLADECHEQYQLVIRLRARKPKEFLAALEKLGFNDDPHDGKRYWLLAKLEQFVDLRKALEPGS